MIRAIANKSLDLTGEEFEYYKELKNAFGEECMLSLFKSNKKGEIVAITPNLSSPTHLAVVFFFLNVMLNQRLRKVDGTIHRISSIEERLSAIEASIATLNEKNFSEK